MDLKLRRMLLRRGGIAVPLLVAVGLAGAAAPAAARTHRSDHVHTISKKQLIQLKATVQRAEQAPVWKAPGPPVKGSVLKGKTIIAFPVSSEIGSCVTQIQDFVRIARKLGATVRSLPSTTGPTGWATNLGDAISDHAAAVAMFCGVVNAAVMPQLQELAAHHIPVVDGAYNEAPPKFFKGISAVTGSDTAGGVAADLADALVNLDGKPAHILYVTTSQIIQDVGVGATGTDKAGAYPALKAAIRRWCPGSCTINKVENLQTTQWPTDGSIIASDLNADHGINTLVVPFDGAIIGMLNEVQAAAATHPGLKIYSWGGSASDERNVQHSPVFAADAGSSKLWSAASEVDQLIRLLNHQKPASARQEMDPNVLFTKQNVASSFAGPGITYSQKAYGHGTFLKDFYKLWGVK